jgi:catechol 2,3-dioxygenase-like lactoylglutathione lyase family enzyme
MVRAPGADKRLNVKESRMLNCKPFMVGILSGLATILGCRAPALAAEETPAVTATIGIDHIPLAVNDLASATETYRRLGFAIKPGRFHADGIRNNHIKFEDGGGIELITASALTDALTAGYLKLLSQGEGPAYVGFHTANLRAVRDGLEHLGQAYSLDNGILEFTNAELQWLFLFEGTNRSPTDRPEHFAHPNSANATLAVWIAGRDQPQILALFKACGARIEQKQVYVPDQLLATVATVANGEVIFLPASRQIIPGRPIVGVVFRTRDLSAVQRVLRSANAHEPVKLETDTYRSLFVASRDTHGVWIEFREPRQ